MEKEWFLIDVRQGCISSLYFFNLDVEHIIWKSKIEADEGVKITGRNLI